uniref:Probable RuBisCO transcriptional regulator n=1 Tax=Hapterophycus canaliculatus TaxID=2567908 RepID=A0A5A4MHG3_9PHAE|nr:putative RuBisCO transcriptional regulator [Hapterophycus canaliculatus]AXU40756.1 putative RuBisCO transcriptional regulator [Hapterophycus canaliculatus]
MKNFSFNLEQLKIIQAVKNEGNLKTVAKFLYLSQPALSLQIKNLEENLYSKILIRKKKQIYFTPEGELILDYANKILELCEEVDKAVLCLKNFKKFSLRVGSDKSIGEYISIKLIDLFSKRYPYTHVQLKISSTQNISWEIINGKIDIGIVQDNMVPRNIYNSLSVTPYFQDKMVLILPKTYKQKFPTNISGKNFRDLNFIATKSYFAERKPIDNILKKFSTPQKQLKINLELNSINALKRAVGDGLGVSFLSTMLVKEELYAKSIHSLRIEGIDNHNQFTIIVSLKNNESYLCEQFYNYCLILARSNFYNKFLNLEF